MTKQKTNRLKRLLFSNDWCVPSYTEKLIVRHLVTNFRNQLEVRMIDIN